MSETIEFDWYWGWCNRCPCSGFCTEKDTWPAGDGNYYGRLCRNCWFRVNHPDEWEKARLELVGKHSE